MLLLTGAGLGLDTPKGVCTAACGNKSHGLHFLHGGKAPSLSTQILFTEPCRPRVGLSWSGAFLPIPSLVIDRFYSVLIGHSSPGVDVQEKLFVRGVFISPSNGVNPLCPGVSCFSPGSDCCANKLLTPGLPSHGSSHSASFRMAAIHLIKLFFVFSLPFCTSDLFSFELELNPNPLGLSQPSAMSKCCWIPRALVWRPP